MPYLVDTDILIDYFRNNRAAGERLDSMGAWAYSVVTAMELFAGADNNREIGRIERFLGSYREIPLSEIVGSRGRAIMKTYAKSDGLDPMDSLLAASAMTENLTFATRNAKHFRNIEGLSLEIVKY